MRGESGGSPELGRRAFLASGAAAIATSTLSATRAMAEPQDPLILNDASKLNLTTVARRFDVGEVAENKLIASLRAELKLAASEKRPVSLGCARHSMGGQSLYPQSTALTFVSKHCEPDIAGRRYMAAAGARWRDVIATLDPLGFSPAVMQSNNDFGVGGTLSVNAHGWAVPFGPAGTTAKSFRLMLADGTVLRCSPDENAELYGLVIGGYGLFGIILDAELEMTENLLLDPEFKQMPSGEFGPLFAEAAASGATVPMAYGRMSVARDGFFDEALMITYRPLPSPSEGLPAVESGGFINDVSRRIFRGQVGSELTKKFRWFVETDVGPVLAGGKTTRNTLLNEPVANLAGGDRRRTDILHEYFVSPDRFAEFLDACKSIIPQSKQELLNVTLRYVMADRTSALAYAPVPRIAAVMLFSQKMDDDAEADMRRMTEALIDKVLDIGGSFYLPYRLHARRDQVARAYPALPHFIDRKHHYDPEMRFRNIMWDRYFA